MLFEMTRKRALELDMLWCECGHRPNNHFDFNKRPCAHCDCKIYKERSRMGVELKKE